MKKAGMLRPDRTHERLVALFLLGVLMFTPPLLALFNKATRVLGVPALYLYLFAAWAVVIALVALAVDRVTRDDDPAGGGQAPPAVDGPRNIEG
jgi:hypothetical protein